MNREANAERHFVATGYIERISGSTGNLLSISLTEPTRFIFRPIFNSLLTGDELRALAEATYAVPQYKAPGLLAWIDAACEWELNRRAGMHYGLAPPEAAIPEDEDAERFAGAQRPSLKRVK